MEQLNSLYLVQLKKIAKELKIKGRTKMNKKNLIKEHYEIFQMEEIINRN